MKTILVILALGFFVVPVYAQGGDMNMSLDTASIVKTGNGTWLASFHWQLMTVTKNVSIVRSTSREEVDCERSTIRTISSSYYNSRGAFIRSQKESMKWTTPPKGTAGAKMIAWVCRLKEG